VSSAEQIAACLTNGTLPGGTPVQRWGIGNCDGDGTTNGAEAVAGCDHCDNASSPPMCGLLVDAGGLEPDSGVGMDAGAPDGGIGMDAGEPDAGEPDAGEPDAGELDAGELDAGELDAGEPDAGEPVDGGPVVDARPAMDGGPQDTGDRDLSFRGGGGCVCGAAPHRGIGGLHWLATLSVFGLLGYRRRRIHAGG
jgi:hypothetical protein